MLHITCCQWRSTGQEVSIWLTPESSFIPFVSEIIQNGVTLNIPSQTPFSSRVADLLYVKATPIRPPPQLALESQTVWRPFLHFLVAREQCCCGVLLNAVMITAHAPTDICVQQNESFSLLILSPIRRHRVPARSPQVCRQAYRSYRIIYRMQAKNITEFRAIIAPTFSERYKYVVVVVVLEHGPFHGSIALAWPCRC